MKGGQPKLEFGKVRAEGGEEKTNTELKTKLGPEGGEEKTNTELKTKMGPEGGEETTNRTKNPFEAAPDEDKQIKVIVSSRVFLKELLFGLGPKSGKKKTTA